MKNKNIKTENKDDLREISIDFKASPFLRNLKAGIAIKWFSEFGAQRRTDGKIDANKNATVEHTINSKVTLSGKIFVI